MKKFLSLMLIAAAALTVASCDKGENTEVENPVLEEVKITFTQAKATYYADEYDNGNGSYRIILRADSPDKVQKLELKFISTLARNPEAASPKSGTYEPGSKTEAAVNTFIPGEGVTVLEYSGTVLTEEKSTMSDLLTLDKGTFTITKSGSNYKISTNLENSSEKILLKGTFDGTIEFDYDDTVAPGNIEKTLEKSKLGFTYGERYQKGTTNFGFTLYEGQWSTLQQTYVRPYSYLEVSGFTAKQTDLNAFKMPAGTYTMDENGRMNGTANTIYPAEAGYADGMRYVYEDVDGNTGEISLTGGSMVVTETGGKYTITGEFSGYDMKTGKPYNKIKLNYTAGEIEFGIDDYTAIEVIFDDATTHYWHALHSTKAGLYETYIWKGELDPNYSAPSKLKGAGYLISASLYSDLYKEYSNARLAVGTYEPSAYDDPIDKFTYTAGERRASVYPNDPPFIWGSKLVAFNEEGKEAKDYPITSGNIIVEKDNENTYTISGEMLLRYEQPFKFRVVTKLPVKYDHLVVE